MFLPALMRGVVLTLTLAPLHRRSPCSLPICPAPSPRTGRRVSLRSCRRPLPRHNRPTCPPRCLRRSLPFLQALYPRRSQRCHRRLCPPFRPVSSQLRCHRPHLRSPFCLRLHPQLCPCLNPRQFLPCHLLKARTSLHNSRHLYRRVCLR